ncbi:MAG: hypothetical protein J5614_06785 [Paludibacteraceae bacterium]|nr:hypothetical protein [Paludibacteraceae bacterium]
MSIVHEVMVNILIFFVIGVMIVVGNALTNWLKAMADKNKESGTNQIYAMLYDVVRFVVQGIEQMYLGDVGGAAGWTSSEKKHKAAEQIMDWVNQNGYSGMISEKLVDSIIEACVKEMNDEADLGYES